MISWIALGAAGLLLHDVDEVFLLGYDLNIRSLLEVRIIEGEPISPRPFLVVPDDLMLNWNGHVYPTANLGLVASFGRKNPEFRRDDRVIGIELDGQILVDFPGSYPVPLDDREHVVYSSRCDTETWSTCLFIRNVKSDGGERDPRIYGPFRFDNHVGLLKTGPHSITWFDPEQSEFLILTVGQNAAASTQSHDVPCIPLAYTRRKDAIVCLSWKGRSEAFLYSVTRREILQRFPKVDGIPVGYLHGTNELLIYANKRSLVSVKEISGLFALDANGRVRTLVRPFPVLEGTLTYFD
jgi:hypothetical protein